MQGWHESYFEMDVPSTVLNITITNKSLVDASYRNKPILIHDISIQEFWNNAVWVRPKSIFTQKITINWELIPRFKYIWNETYKNI